MSDLISREEAIKAVKFYETFCDPYPRVIEALEELPSAQPRKGKWIYGESEIGHDGYYCTKCGNFVPWKYGEYDIDFIKEFLFCNKCGSDMRPQFEEPEINPCRGCEDYDGKGGCKTKGGCADRRGESDE